MAAAIAACAASEPSDELDPSNDDLADEVDPNRPDAQPRPQRPDGGATTPDAAPPLPCVEGDERVSDPDSLHCYALFTSNLEWTDAEATCAGMGAHLATITDPAEFELIKSLVGRRDVWIGGTDAEAENTWLWQNGEDMAYENWKSGEPNNSDGREDCMLLDGDAGGRWDDRRCRDDHDYLCERD